jgi:stearoyl-CoA desaturase (delta-9 desaturase)
MPLTDLKCDSESGIACLPFLSFDRFIQKTYYIHVVLPLVALYYYGGFPALVWGGALRIVWVWHHTWNVNSVAHVWGTQTYKTGSSTIPSSALHFF